ncbi:ATP-binding protein [Microbulbifer sp. 2205BS26-8]|uniref:ATP-binding protein n=1 Tax=Microbulbifer sp. 2205BS26-8 TaxID=3064386 RepID=UPI00273D2632|nr:ATP-binding protein [Microbulbifer sp. 2205BS26-8]MDP5210932.1 ATP-binding protein [Microbulbifer sp. 2205BS26-8]
MPLTYLLEELLEVQQSRITAAGLKVEVVLDRALKLYGERFLLRQALANLLDNALDFTPQEGLIRFTAKRKEAHIELCLFNQGEAIPEYALERLTERFYSLPRPGSGRKSTGLGLNFVQEVAGLHGGALSVSNVEGGVEVRLNLPSA